VNKSLARRTNLVGAWCGVAYVVLLFVGWFVVAGLFPMHRPSASAEEIARFYHHDVISIRLGMIMVMWAAAVFIPFTATMADYVARFEGRDGPLSRIMTMAGYANAMLTFYPPLWWIASTWRADERSADTTRLLNDVAWLQFIGGLSLIMPMFVVMTVVVFNDRSAEPVFPRWLGYQSIMTFLLCLPDQLLFFFKTGPFAWNGVLGFWVPATVFSTWFISIFYCIRRSVLTEMRTVEQRIPQPTG
jgi:hypothetical protein